MALELEQENGGVNMIYSIFSYADNMTFSTNCIFIKEKTAYRICNRKSQLK